MKKRILLILTEFPPRIGGMQTHAIMLSKRLVEMGSTVTVFTYRPSGNLDECRDVDSEFSFPVHRVLSRIVYFRNIELLLRGINDFDPHIIYSSTVFYGILEKLTGVPVICRSVGNDILRPWIAYPYKICSSLLSSAKIERPIYDFYKKMDKPERIEILLREKRLNLTVDSAKSATKILANSNFTRDLLLEAGVLPERIQLVVGGVDTSFFKRPPKFNKDECKNRLCLPPGRKILLTVCRLVDKKGLDFLISSFAAVNPAKKKWHLVIVGNGRRQKRLKRMAVDLNVSEYITFVGAVPYSVMPPYYWVSDIFVLASTVFKDPSTGLKDAETMGRVLCEANAAGLPVLATESGGIPSVITHGDNGLLFLENSREQFYRNIKRLLKDKLLRRHLINCGLKRAREEFDWKHVIGEHERAFALEEFDRSQDAVCV
ncbi:glycosyltransferase family 4 protein [Spirochaetota bacterium]